MSIEQQRTVEVLAVELQDDLSIGITATDIFTGQRVVVALTHDEAHQHVDEVLAVIAETRLAIVERATLTEEVWTDLGGVA